MSSETPQIWAENIISVEVDFQLVQGFHASEANKTAGQPTSTWDLLQ